MVTPYVLKLQCPDRPGVVAKVTTAIFGSGGNVIEAQQFNDPVTGWFFMRVAFDLAQKPGIYDSLCETLTEVGHSLSLELEWKLFDASVPSGAVILVSKQDHCLRDLLYNASLGDIKMDVKAIISNHPKDAFISSIGSIPFHHLPVTRETKPQQEQQIREIVEATKPELVILARYMQILSNDLSKYLKDRCINIHHSFLPGFKGARPYLQAYERGVKIIGATAHYVTSDLDEGPIIAQDVEHVSHADTPEELSRRGRDIERRVLTRAVKFHTEHRVFVHGNRTIVFS
ncbi:MAG: formyltetrahydrofolate deformylase [Bryocella sp.]